MKAFEQNEKEERTLSNRHLLESLHFKGDTFRASALVSDHPGFESLGPPFSSLVAPGKFVRYTKGDNNGSYLIKTVENV